MILEAMDINPRAYVADLHIHSRFSRATARSLDLPHIAAWAAKKGVRLVGSGDLTHPGWLAEMKELLRPAAEGLFRLTRPAADEGAVRFILSGEISCIYKKDGRVRKIHLVVLLPSLPAAEGFNQRLARIGNLASDGRPILGVDAKRILELVLETDPLAELIPAHIWTPWFSVLGSKSGFDSLAECFEDLTPHIHAVETGLSSDPPMNWRVSSLDGFHLVSSSDAHSPAKLGREATLFSAPLTYPDVIEALRTGQGLEGTLEFFPEEGKYHLDGHRKCRVRLSPPETRAFKGLCPVCGRPLTVGVLNRVEVLADRRAEEPAPEAKPFKSLLSLSEILAQALGVGAQSQKVSRLYEEMIARLGPELDILRLSPLEDIERAAGPAAAEGVNRVRRGQVQAEAGFDGQFGTLTLFSAQERAEINRQKSLFTLQPAARPALHRRAWEAPEAILFPDLTVQMGPGPRSDPDQEAAVAAPPRPLAVVARPGGGKTRVLTRRILRLLSEGQPPERILALTFTRQAAEELAGRLARVASPAGERVRVSTFHALGLSLLREWGCDWPVLDEDERLSLIRPLAKKAAASPSKAGEAIARTKLNPEGRAEADVRSLVEEYQRALAHTQALDFEDLLARPLQMAAKDELKSVEAAARFDHVLVDEFQDLNRLQFAWLSLLCPQPERSLSVVGDPDQAIYGFRGASPAFFEDLAALRPELKRIELGRSHRCPPSIIDAARAVIAHNPGRHLPLRSARPAGSKLRLAALPSPKAEAVFIVQEMERLLGGSSHLAIDSGAADGHEGCSLADMAVLFRLHRQAEEIVEVMEQSGLPYQVAGQEPGRETDALELGAEKITLLTCHAAKGLEFPFVFIAGCEAGLLPYRPPEGREDIFEERRLFYVALTRARERAVLTWSRRRTLFGQRLSQGPSPFIQEIPAPLIEVVEAVAPKPRQVQMSLF